MKGIVSKAMLTLLLIGTLVLALNAELNNPRVEIGAQPSEQKGESSPEPSEQGVSIENQSDSAQTLVFVITPSVVTITVGQSFSVNVEVMNAPLVTQWILSLTWNPAILQIIDPSVDIKEGNFLKQSGGLTIFLYFPPKPGAIEEVTSGVLSKNDVSGDGILCTITFKAIASGISPLHLGRGVLLLGLNKIYPKLQDGSVTVFDGVPLPPTANFTLTPTKPKVGWSVTFDASASIPNEGEITSYEWIFGDGQYASGKTVTHTYISPSTYTVTLKVTDSEGLWDTEQKLIKVELAWTGPVYIRVDGSIDPPTAPIQRNGDFYTLTGNIISRTNGIVIEKGNVTLDGAGYTVQGIGEGTGIYPSGRINITIRNMEVIDFFTGITIPSNSRVIRNNVMNNDIGIIVGLNSSVTENNIAKNHFGIMLPESSGNTVVRNNITENDQFGIFIEYSSNNSIYHNNFINNRVDVFTRDSVNIWDNGYPSGGNYWSNFISVDVKSGRDQDLSGSDGIGDTPYVIYADEVDHYPSMNRF